MKRVGFLYDQSFTLEALYDAYEEAARHKEAKSACFEFKKNLGANIERLHRKLNDGTYKPLPYFSFFVYEPKLREIYAPAFSDLVVQHAIYAKIYPIFNSTFIDQSYACRKGLGTHKAADYAQESLQASRQESYTLKLDIRKFFYRIDRAILRTLLEKKIKDKRYVDLMMEFAEYGNPLGIPIGNLLSQLYALIYLNPLDHYVKRELKIKLYCRYVDDFILFGLEKGDAEVYLVEIIEFISSKLNLELSKYTIAPRKRGVNFVGYRTWHGKRFIRKHSLYKFAKAAKKDKLQSVVSILGHARKSHSLRYLQKLLKEKHHDLYLRLPKVYRQREDRRAPLPGKRFSSTTRT